MLAAGQEIRSTAGKGYAVEDVLGEGGQGKAWRVHEVTSGERAVVKLFDPAFVAARPNVGDRTKALVDLALWRSAGPLGVLAGAPRELVVAPSLGYVARLVPGAGIHDYLASHLADRHATLAVATALAHGLDELERRGLAHGDLSPGNVLALDMAGVPVVFLIDYDNVRLPIGDTPPVIGTPLYMAPELYQGARASLETDRFGLGVLIHEALLGRHPATAYMPNAATTAIQQQVMARNNWVGADEHLRAGGLPSRALSTRIRRMLRRALSTDPSVRPRAGEWYRVLRAALEELWECPKCQLASMNDLEAQSCGVCGEPAEARRLVLDHGTRTVEIARPAMRVGREVLRAEDVSGHHATFEWRGYELTLRDVSRHGTFIKVGDLWVPTPKDQAIAVRIGDELRFGRRARAFVA